MEVFLPLPCHGEPLSQPRFRGLDRPPPPPRTQTFALPSGGAYPGRSCTAVPLALGLRNPQGLRRAWPHPANKCGRAAFSTEPDAEVYRTLDAGLIAAAQAIRNRLSNATENISISSPKQLMPKPKSVSFSWDSEGLSRVPKGHCGI